MATNNISNVKKTLIEETNYLPMETFENFDAYEEHLIQLERKKLEKYIEKMKPKILELLYEKKISSLMKTAHQKKINVNQKSKSLEEYLKIEKIPIRFKRLTTKGKMLKPNAPPVSCNCKQQCFEGISKNTIANVRQKLYSLPDYAEQNMFLSTLIHVVPSRVHRKDVRKPREVMHVYHIPVDDKLEKVCRRAFESIFGLGSGKIPQLFKRITDGRMSDLRGRCSNLHQLQLSIKAECT